jgi:hypothetical protein
LSKLADTAASIASGLFWLAVVVGGGLYALANFGKEVTHYKCDGILMQYHESRDAALYMRRERFRWPITMWADRDGSIEFEVPHGPSGIAWPDPPSANRLNLRKIDGGFVGHFSLLSRSLVLRAPDQDAYYSGMCEPVDR